MHTCKVNVNNSERKTIRNGAICNGAQWSTHGQFIYYYDNLFRIQINYF